MKIPKVDQSHRRPLKSLAISFGGRWSTWRIPWERPLRYEKLLSVWESTSAAAQVSIGKELEAFRSPC